MIGEKMFHYTLGNGVVTQMNADYVFIEFKDKVIKQFQRAKLGEWCMSLAELSDPIEEATRLKNFLNEQAIKEFKKFNKKAINSDEGYFLKIAKIFGNMSDATKDDAISVLVMDFFDEDVITNDRFLNEINKVDQLHLTIQAYKSRVISQSKFLDRFNFLVDQVPRETLKTERTINYLGLLSQSMKQRRDIFSILSDRDKIDTLGAIELSQWQEYLSIITEPSSKIIVLCGCVKFIDSNNMQGEAGNGYSSILALLENQIAKLLTANNVSQYLRLFPDRFKRRLDVFCILPDKVKVNVLATIEPPQWPKYWSIITDSISKIKVLSWCIQFIIPRYNPLEYSGESYMDTLLLENEIAKLLTEINVYECLDVLSQRVKQRLDVLYLLPDEYKVNVMLEVDQLEWPKYWSALKEDSNIIKVLYGFIQQNNKVLTVEASSGMMDSVAKTLFLSATSSNCLKKKNYFVEFHKTFQENIIGNAWNISQELNIDYFIPRCTRSKTHYCEGKPWPSVDEILTRNNNNFVDKAAYCPRLREKCLESEGARIWPNHELLYQNWSLLEVFAQLHIEPVVTGLRNAEEYVPKMAGWINRLLEIRDRINCLRCGEVMVPNLHYSVNLAAYNATVFNCCHGDGHDHNVYISHCWSCRDIIDSRDNRIRDKGGYYLCLRCGSGARKSTHQQGDICPQCGMVKMDKSTGLYEERIRTCNACQHQIKVPKEFS